MYIEILNVKLMQTVCNYLTMQDDLRKYKYVIFYFIYIINYDEVKKCFYCNKIINPFSVIENIWKYIYI